MSPSEVVSLVFTVLLAVITARAGGWLGWGVCVFCVVSFVLAVCEAWDNRHEEDRGA